MPVFRWMNQHIIPFLESYRRYECLWNSESEDYTRKEKREKAYECMVKDLNLPGLNVECVVSKIKTIRTTYRRELNKVQAFERDLVTGDADEIYKPRLFWYEYADSFLHDVRTLKQTSPISANLKYESCTSEADAESSSSGIEEFVISEPRTKRCCRTPEPTDESKQSNQSMNSAFKSTFNHVLAQTKSIQQDDECAMYGKILAEKLRHFNAFERMKLMYEIDGLVLKKRVKLENEDALP